MVICCHKVEGIILHFLEKNFYHAFVFGPLFGFTLLLPLNFKFLFIFIDLNTELSALWCNSFKYGKLVMTLLSGAFWSHIDFFDSKYNDKNGSTTQDHLGVTALYWTIKRHRVIDGSSTETVTFQVYKILKIDHEFLQFFWLGSKI